MAKLVTLAQLKQRAKVRADMENSNFVETSVDLVALINASGAWFYDLLIPAAPEYFLQSATLTPDPTTGIASLPADFYKCLGVDLVLGPSERVSLDPYEFAERNTYVGGSIGSQEIELFYAPPWTDLVDDDDTVDGYNGWDEFIVVDVARKMLGKEESDTTELVGERQELIKRVEAQAATRNVGSSKRWQDVQNQGSSLYLQGLPVLRYLLQKDQIKFVQAVNLGGGL